MLASDLANLVEENGDTNGLVPSIDIAISIDDDGNLVVAESGDNTDDDLTIRFDGTNYQFTLAGTGVFGVGAFENDETAGIIGTGTQTVTVPAALFSGSIIVSALGGNDRLTVDLDSGTPTANILFEGGSQNGSPGDTLSILGGTFSEATYNFANENDGSVQLGDFQITYTGLEPITSTVNATDVTLNFGAAGETITVTDGGVGQTTVDSTAGEITTFNNPTETLTIHTESGGGGGSDTVVLQGVGSGFDADLIVDAGTDDAIRLESNTTSLGSGDAALTAGNVRFVDGNLVTTGSALITATSGSITTDNVNTIDLTAADAVLRAIDAVGASGIGGWLDLSVANLEGTAGPGGFFVWGANDLTIGGVTGLNGVGTTGGPIELYSVGGDLIVSETVASSGGNIELETGIALPSGGNIVLDAPVLSSGGRVLVAADNDITMNAGGSIDTGAGSTAPVSLTADDNGSGVGAIDMSPSTFIDGWAGDVTLNAAENISLSLVRSSATTSLNSEASIFDSDGGSALNIDGRGSGTLEVIALTAFGTPSDPIETAVSRMAGEVAAGGIITENAVALELVDLIGTGFSVGAAGPMTINTAGSLTVSDNLITTAGTIILSVADTTASGEDIMIGANVSVNATGGDVQLLAGDDVEIDPASILESDMAIQIAGDVGDADSGTGTTINILGTLIGSSATAMHIVSGAGDDDSIIVDPTSLLLASPLSLDGVGGDDDYNVTFGQLGTGIAIDDSADGEDNAVLMFAVTDDSMTVDGQNNLVRDDASNETVTFNASLEEILVDSGLGNDTVNVSPSPTTRLQLSGNDPTTAPGDTLNVDALSNALNLNQNVLTVDGLMPITHQNFEAFSFANVTDFTIEADDNDNAVRVTLNGENTDVIIDGITVLSQPLADLPRLTINGNSGDDAFTVDFANGNPIPAGGLFFNGNAQDTTGDSVILENGSANTIEHTFANENDGTIDIDGSMVTYTGLEPIIDNLNAADRIFTFTGGDETITLGDDLVNATGVSRIDSTLGESVDFLNPTNSLTVNTGSGVDSLNVNALDANYAASLIVDGGDSDNDVLTMTNVDLINTLGRGLWVKEFETVTVTGGTISGNTADNGAGVRIDNSTLATTTATLSGITISNNVATGGTAPNEGGGGIYNNGAVLNINANSLISFNTATTAQGSGGGIFSNGILTITDSTISDNDANRAGGGIEIAAGSGPTTLTNVSFYSNRAVSGPGNGGGLHVTGAGNVQMKDGVIIGNSAASEGGGFWNGAGTMTLDSVIVEANVARSETNVNEDQGGGGIFNNGGTLLIENLTDIRFNQAIDNSGNGGGVMTVGGTVTFNNINIRGNEAGGSGGGIANLGGTVTLNGSAVGSSSVGTDQNSASEHGGAIYASGNAATVLSGALIRGNAATQNGGGLFNGADATMTITGGDITDNTASGNAVDQGGGGVFNAGGTVDVTDTFIDRNMADGSSGNGGGIMTMGGTVNLVDLSLATNEATRAGGGIENNGGTVTLTNVFVGGANPSDANTAGINGGGLHASGVTSVTTINDGSFQNNIAAQEGGGLWIGDGTLTINGTTILQNTANSSNNPNDDQGGGGIFNIGGTLDINGATITENVAVANNGNGGGVMTVGGTVTIDDSSIQSNAAGRAGGGIENNNGSVTITNETVGGPVAASGNTATINGGGLHASGDNSITIVTGGLFQNNTAGHEGGGLWNGTGVMTINGTQILNNTAESLGNTNNDQGGGGVFNIGGTLVISDAAIHGNVALLNSGNGGGVMTVGGTVTIDETAIQSNQAARAGGGIENNNGEVMLTNVTLGGADPADGNHAGINGGGLHASGSASTTTLIGGIVQNNIAEQEGGGLWNGPGQMSVNQTDILDNTANSGVNTNNDQGGGGVFNIGGTLNLTETTIVDNAATANRGNGGGVMTVGGTVTAMNTTVTSNESGRDGGGLHAGGGSVVTVTGGNFRLNNAAEEGGGLWNDSVLRIDGSLITENTAVSSDNGGNNQGGGGVFNDGGTLDIAGATISINSAIANNGNGGGVMTVGGSVTIDSTLIQSNQATRAGGGIENSSGDVTITGVTLGGPTANDGNTTGINGGGLHAAGVDSTITIIGGSVQNNIADQEGGGLWLGGASTLSLDGTTVSNNTANSANAANDAQGGGGIFNDGG
ncbi:right-handed parallel beta-helix repeat-containing protein, partial [Rhodopirellula sallentina]|uniref:right-handed parallel beta-helix repeat-containing protein n=1 Tax=Rhodopirellula sallentina TaxID=1263869 RepID=UPI001360B4E6